VECGPRWGCLSQERESRFVVAWGFGSSEEAAAPGVVEQTRERTAGRRGIVWVSDGSGSYEKWVKRVYRDPVRTGRAGRPRLEATPGVGLTQVIKTREGRRIVDVRVRHCFGPNPARAHTVRIERRNGVLRDRLNCLTRKTHAFAKRDATWDAAVTLSLFEENWMRPHVALRIEQAGLPAGRKYLQRSPAMALGLTDHIWAWTEFLTRRARH
jgi:hypothetical protein